MLPRMRHRRPRSHTSARFFVRARRALPAAALADRNLPKHLCHQPQDTGRRNARREVRAEHPSASNTRRMARTGERKSKGALLQTLLFNERIHMEDDLLGAEDRAPNLKVQRLDSGGRLQPNRQGCKRWTKVEEAVLASLVDQHGENAWASIADAMPDRTEKAVEQHWAVMQGTHASVRHGGAGASREPVQSSVPQLAAGRRQDVDDATDDGDGDAEDDVGGSADAAASSLRCAFLEREARLPPAGSEAARPSPSSMPVWIPPELVAVSACAAAARGKGAPPLYATTVVHAEAID